MTIRHRQGGWGFAVAMLVALVARGGPSTAAAQTIQTFQCPTGFAEEAAVAAVAPILLSSLAVVENPVLPRDPVTQAYTIRGDLAGYIANLEKAIQLGKAFFWDMQVGSDDRTACATCHFAAGADTRTRNQLNPGANGSWDSAAFGPNIVLWQGGYPFTHSGFDTDNATGSQGIRKSRFIGFDSNGNERTALVADPVFNVGGVNVRQVTGITAPPVVNAVHNFRNFYNGRAQAEFNGVNPFGQRDLSARVYQVNSLGGATKISIVIKNASLASQAVGPVLNPVEMSASGRTFPDVGRKLLPRRPLALQQVAAADSVLGPLVDSQSGTGLDTTYWALIQEAFTPKWWNSGAQIPIAVNGVTKYYSMMEANFSLYWGLAVMLYEATLVSDDTPLDRFLRFRATPGALPQPTQLAELDAAAARFGLTRQNILNGLDLFEKPLPPAPPLPSAANPAVLKNGVGCIFCHGGAQTTNGSVQALTEGVEVGDQDFKKAGYDLRMERMFWQIPGVPVGTNQVTLDTSKWTVTATNTVKGTTAGPCLDMSDPSCRARVATYDTGFYNIGVRPTREDLGLDATDPWLKPLSFTRYLQGRYVDPSFIKVPGDGLACGGVMVKNATNPTLLSGGLRKTELAGTGGSFKVSPLRNVELTGPYFHNGGKSTLAQLVEFYDNGGDFSNPTLAPLITPLSMLPEQQRDLTAFLLALTDERVRLQSAPFDHPQLFIPDGDDPSSIGVDSLIELPAVGASGGDVLQPFLGLWPFLLW